MTPRAVVPLAASAPRCRQRVLLGTGLFAIGVTMAGSIRASDAPPLLRHFCVECHGGDKPKAALNVEQLLAKPSIGAHAEQWEKIAEMIETAEMPPAEAERQPTAAERATAAAWVRAQLRDYERAHAGEPGTVTVRRLTSGELAYALRDLTGVDLPLAIDASGDAVGGEGFTNFGDVQFVQDVSVERYLETAKLVAQHAMIGAGPLQFHPDPGRTGLEIFALNRINALYRDHGFRVVSGEGGRPFGLERYGQAFFVAWYYRHRAALGDPAANLRDLGAKEGITGRFAEHIWSVVNRAPLGFPSREMVGRWQAVAAPAGDVPAALAAARAACEELSKYLTSWPSWFFARGDIAAGGLGDESPLVFDDKSLAVVATHHYVHPLASGGRSFGRGRGEAASGALGAPEKIPVSLAITDLRPTPGVKPVVIWRNARIITRAMPTFGRGRGEPAAPVTPVDPNATANANAASTPGRGRFPPGPILSTKSLRELLSPERVAALGFGTSPDGSAMGPDDFVTHQSVTLELPPGAPGQIAELQLDAELGADRDAVIRVLVSGVTRGPTRGGGRARILLGDPASAGYRSFRAGLAEYVALLPPNSHGEANPADKDPVPAPFDSTYNTPEHDAFVMKVKYQRTDAFFTENMVDGEDRARLNHAWHDLFGSWPYHDAYLDLLAEHYGQKLNGRRIQQMDAGAIAAWPEAARAHVSALRTHYDDVRRAHAAAEPGHVEDALAFASRAWRRPLTSAEQTTLRAFYRQARTAHALDHSGALRALLSRILVSPAFLYRLEPAESAAERPLDDWELASRLSFFLWSSIPDEELRRAAAARELRDPARLARQVKRMCADPKARRLATEFFGQWLGFYRFDEFRGVDTTHFPEFSSDVQRAMYDEAVSTFEYLVREGRPLREMLHADFAFLNRPLAKFYGIERDIPAGDEFAKVDGASAFGRGGALRLGAVLTTTSAPLRTSPVKRGDWVLRRILGTPTPPPPGDAGTLPADPKAFGGLTLRQKLEDHKRDAACANCHVRIDPLGFPLEAFDAVGRLRTTYEDGTAIDVTGELADKSTLVGADGLLKFLATREPLVMKTLGKKMIGYALGRTVLASDRALVDEMVSAGGAATFADLATKIVLSRQFRHRAGTGSDPGTSRPSQ